MNAESPVDVEAVLRMAPAEVSADLFEATRLFLAETEHAKSTGGSSLVSAASGGRQEGSSLRP
jgi:hypothetical protein